MSETDRARSPITLGIKALDELTRPALLRTQQTVEFAGFLTREDDESLYIADPQGTWVIRREDVVFLEDWKHADCAPELMAQSGRPVRVGIREGATIHEIRPWLIRRGPALGGPRVRQVVESIFTLGGAPLPIGERTILGEQQLADLERTFVRRLGWAPDNCDDPRSTPYMRSSRLSSLTMVLYNGY
jgi:hypothetical protein